MNSSIHPQKIDYPVLRAHAAELIAIAKRIDKDGRTDVLMTEFQIMRARIFELSGSIFSCASDKKAVNDYWGLLLDAEGQQGDRFPWMVIAASEPITRIGQLTLPIEVERRQQCALQI
jgi:hypothetical protein